MFYVASVGQDKPFIEVVKQVIEDTPTADVVKVVRCRNCRWWTKEKDSRQGRCGMYGRYPTGAWYCANGERREE